MYCCDFQEYESTNEGEQGMSRFAIRGFLFDEVKPVWTEPCPSTRIGLSHVSKLNLCQLITVSAMDLVSKCFVSEKGHTPMEPAASDPMPGSFKVILRQFLETPEGDLQDRIEEKLLAEGTRYKNTDRSYLNDYWWTWSIVQPGRFPNYFQ